MRPVDLRSDTVTRPTSPMRHAMADADVGDDVYGDDPTVRALEEQVADLLGFEAALYTTSGTQANQIALRAHTRPGDEVIISRDAHCWRHESGALGALAGLQTQQAADYVFTGAEVRARFRGEDPYSAPTRVVAVENTHNMGGGICWDVPQLADVTGAAHALGMTTHLDGARIWNAAIALGRTERELAAGFDSASVCFSKGLGAPVGSAVLGSRDFIRLCHRYRKMYGGGMRQAGIIAAGAKYALDHHRARIVEDHELAKALAEQLAGHRNLTVGMPQTNIVMIDLAHGTAAAATALAREEGIWLGSAGPQRVRAVTHLDVDREGIDRAAQALAAIASQLAAA